MRDRRYIAQSQISFHGEGGDVESVNWCICICYWYIRGAWIFLQSWWGTFTSSPPVMSLTIGLLSETKKFRVYSTSILRRNAFLLIRWNSCHRVSSGSKSWVTYVVACRLMNRSFLARDAFVRTNRRTIAIMSVCLSVRPSLWDRRTLSSYGAV